MKIFLTGQRSFGAAALRHVLELGHEVLGVSAPWSDGEERADKLRLEAEIRHVPVVPSTLLTADTLPAGVDVIVAAHSHAFVGRRTRFKARIGAIGYHPSLLPRHRGRDAVRWAVHMGDPIAGGTVYWLSDNVDAGDIAAQDWCWVRPDDDASSLWRRELFPMGLRLIADALADLDRGKIVKVPQDERVATWEPSWDRPPLHRPDLHMIGGPIQGYEVVTDRQEARRMGRA